MTKKLQRSRKKIRVTGMRKVHKGTWAEAWLLLLVDEAGKKFACTFPNCSDSLMEWDTVIRAMRFSVDNLELMFKQDDFQQPQKNSGVRGYEPIPL